MGAMLTQLCRQARHTACAAAGGNTESCGCPCHYDAEMAGAAEAAAELEHNAAEPERDDPRDPNYFYCEVAGCDPERRFISKHALAIHKSRAHKPLGIALAPEEPEPPDQEDEVPDVEIEETVDATEWSPLVQDALAAFSFLEGKAEGDIVHEVMDEWAGMVRGQYAEIGAAMELRRKYRELAPG